jgi:hypothetical protein
MREREGPTGKKGNGGQGEEERKEGEAWRAGDAPGVFLIGQGKHEVAMGAPGSSTQVLNVSQRRRQCANFAKSPLGKGDFWRFSNYENLAIFVDRNFF